MRKKFFIFLFFAATALADDLCSSDRIIGVGRGKLKDVAKDNAYKDIAVQITSGLTAKTIVTLDKVTIDGIPFDSSTYSSKFEIYSELINGKAVELLSDSMENDEYVLKYFICRSKAAKPYVDSLDIYLRTKLNAFKQQTVDSAKCAGTKDIYAKMRRWQGILEHLRQMDKALQEEYEKIYAKIEKECDEMGKGIFLKFDDKTSELSRKFAKAFVSKSNISFKQNGKCTGGLEMFVKAKDNGCEKKRISFDCSIDVSLKGTNCSNGEGFSLTGIIKGRALNGDEEKARQQMMVRLGKADFSDFNDWMEKLKPWMEK